IDECAVNSKVCGPHANCTNTNGSYSCICLNGYSTPPGVTLASLSQPCEDINECTTLPFVCGPNTDCTNSNGSYNCSCWKGYKAPNRIIQINNENQCQDIDECIVVGLCGPNAQCINLVGSYNCSCDSGYRPLPVVTLTNKQYPCVDIDDCQQVPPICGPNSICSNIDGSYNCTCETGYKTKSSINQCQDIDECADNSKVCGPHANCTNTNGSYSCICLHGYSTPPGVTLASLSQPCEDINECTTLPFVCGPNTDCTNSNGSYNCSCWKGYKAPNRIIQINNENQCQDIDECSKNASLCGLNAECFNKGGGFDCACKQDYLPSPGLDWEFGKTKCEAKLPRSPESWVGVSRLGVPVCIEFACSLMFLISLQQTVKNYLAMAIKGTTQLASQDATQLSKAFDSYVKSAQLLVSTLVEPTKTESYKTIKTEELEVSLTAIGPDTNLTTIPILEAKANVMEIDLLSIAKHNNGSAAAIFISYSDGATDSLLRADFLKTENVTEMFSDVVSGRIAKTPITNLSEPVNFTLKHKMSKADNGLMTCVYWKISDEEQFWSVEGCTATFSNTTYTVCSCTHLSTFALIMQTERVVQNDDLLDQINKVLVIIGLFFFALAIITFVFCRWNPKINNTARLNLCICLFLAHLIFLVAVSHTENKVICSIIAGVLHYLFLSAFVWMFLESIQLFLLVRSLTKVRIIHREGLRPLYLLLIGYSIPVVVVGVSAGRFPEGYGGDKACWLKNEKGYKWMFLGPVCCILAVNFLLFGAIMWCIRSTLINMKSDVSQVKDTRIIIFKAVVQFVILGCGWILGFFPGTPLLSYLFIVLNSQQGTFIFIVHCLLNKEVWIFLYNLHILYYQSP
ncbi:AGRE1 protein, partial [Amia calva]|nr:AGRE1 protein [Amia calva]